MDYPVHQLEYPVHQMDYPVQQLDYPIQQMDYAAHQLDYPVQGLLGLMPKRRVLPPTQGLERRMKGLKLFELLYHHRHLSFLLQLSG